MPKQFYKYSGVGKRKTAIARIYMNEGSGKISINHRAFDDYFPNRAHQAIVRQAFEITGTNNRFDMYARVIGGGESGQADAIRHGVAKALLSVDAEYRPKLKVAGLLTRDARVKERKKYGQPGARKRFQYSKR